MTGTNKPFWICLPTCLLLAFGLRLGLALDHVDIHRPDEVFETLEPAHRLWSGWGVVTWEWRDGIRSWLFPGFLAGLMRLSAAIGFGSDGGLTFIAAILSLVSLGVVGIGVVLGWRRFGLSGAVLCGMLCAIWPDLVYFAPKTLTEVQGGNVLAIAGGLASLPRAGTRDAEKFVLPASVGLLLGTVFCLRFQYAPGVMVVAAWVGLKYRREEWLGLVAGGAVPLLALGVCDDLTWGSPFQSVWKNFYVNWTEQRSARFGVFPAYWYVWEIIRLSGGAVLPAALLFCAGMRAAPALALVAIVTVLSHSMIAHKEISFVYAAVPAGIIVVGLGTARALSALCQRRPDVPRLGALGFAVLLWAAIIALNVQPAARTTWNDVSRELMPLWLEVRARADLCGLALHGGDFPWYDTGGYSTLNRRVPIFLTRTESDFAMARPGFNYVIVARPQSAMMTGDDTVLCTGTFCLLRHEQPCAPVDALEINAVLAREGG